MSIYINRNVRQTEVFPIPEIKIEKPFVPTRCQRAKNGVRRFLQLNEYDYELKNKDSK